MPNRDGKGPNGLGAMTGRGFGKCSTDDKTNQKTEFNFGCRRGFRRGDWRNGEISSSKTQKDILQEKKHMLQEHLESINKQLEDL